MQKELGQARNWVLVPQLTAADPVEPYVASRLAGAHVMLLATSATFKPMKAQAHCTLEFAAAQVLKCTHVQNHLASVGPDTA